MNEITAPQSTVCTIKSLSNLAWAVNSDGSRRELAAGDQLTLNDSILPKSPTVIELQYSDGFSQKAKIYDVTSIKELYSKVIESAENNTSQNTVDVNLQNNLSPLPYMSSPAQFSPQTVSLYQSELPKEPEKEHAFELQSNLFLPINSIENEPVILIMNNSDIGINPNLSFSPNAVIDGGNIPQNQQAIIDPPSNLILTEDVNVNINGLLSANGNFLITDADAGESLFVAMQVNSIWSNFNLTINGEWSYSADNNLLQSLAQGETIAENFTLESKDGSAQQVFSVTLVGSNDAAQIGGVNTGQVTEDTNVVNNNLSVSGLLTITDVDAGENSFIAGNFSGTYGNLTLLASGNWTYTADNNQADLQSLGLGDSLTDNFTITSIDGSSANLVITLVGSNDAAQIGGVNTGQVTEDTNVVNNNLSVSGLLTITDVDAGENSFIAGNFSGTYGNLTLLASGDWTYTVDNNQTAIQTLNNGQSLPDNFTVSSQDGTAHNLFISINGLNEIPALFTGAGETVNFNSITSGSYLAGTQYNALGGDDTIILPNSVTEANTSGYGLSDSTHTLPFDAGAGNDVITGGALIDTISYESASSGVTVSLGLVFPQATLGAGTDTITQIENILGSDFNDTLTGNTGSNVIAGGLGHDILSGASGTDTLEGGQGNDTLIGGSGNDVFVFSLSQNEGSDVITDFTQSGAQADILRFTDVLDVGTPGLTVADVNAQISSITSGVSSTQVAFLNGSSIIFNGITGTFTSIEQITGNVEVI